MNSVRVITPSRLHFGLLDLNGSGGRVDGSIGLALQSPRCVLEAKRSDRLRVEGVSPSVRDRVVDLVARLRREWGIGEADLQFRETIPLHSGLGSGTQTILAVITALGRLYDVPLSREEIVRLSGRGGTSGIGIYAFFFGGFLVDGGHRFPEEKKAFLPSAASSGVGVGPLLFRCDFPKWEVLLALPKARHISGDEEVQLFQSRCPLSRRSVERLCHRLLMGVLPAVVEKDLPAFGRALEAFQKGGWKRIEIATQEENVRKTMRLLREYGAQGVTMSSWGPTIVGFYDSETSLREALRALKTDSRFCGTLIPTHANNQGAEVVLFDEGREK